MKLTLKTVLVLAATATRTFASKLERKTAERDLRGYYGGKSSGKGGKSGGGGDDAGEVLSDVSTCDVYAKLVDTCTEEDVFPDFLREWICPSQDEVCDLDFTPQAWCAANNAACGMPDPATMTTSPCEDFLLSCCEVQCCEKPETVVDNACQIISLIPQDDTCAIDFNKELCPCGDDFNATIASAFCEDLIGGKKSSSGGKGKGKSSGGKGKSSNYDTMTMVDDECIDTCQAYVESCCAPVELCDTSTAIQLFPSGFSSTLADFNDPPTDCEVATLPTQDGVEVVHTAIGAGSSVFLDPDTCYTLVSQSVSCPGVSYVSLRGVDEENNEITFEFASATGTSVSFTTPSLDAGQFRGALTFYNLMDNNCVVNTTITDNDVEDPADRCKEIVFTE